VRRQSGALLARQHAGAPRSQELRPGQRELCLFAHRQRVHLAHQLPDAAQQPLAQVLVITGPNLFEQAPGQQAHARPGPALFLATGQQPRGGQGEAPVQARHQAVLEGPVVAQEGRVELEDLRVSEQCNEHRALAGRLPVARPALRAQQSVHGGAPGGGVVVEGVKGGRVEALRKLAAHAGTASRSM
jgi:hypothetical protein